MRIIRYKIILEESVNNSDLEKAIILATKLCEGQLDKTGELYIIHSLKVMLKMDTITEQIVAVLHDISKCNINTLPILKDAGFSEEVIISLGLLTKKEDITYMEYIKNLSKNSISRRVKIEDLRQNLNPKKLKSMTIKDLEKLEKHLEASRYLLNKEYEEN